MIEDFSPADVYFIAGIVLCSFDHWGGGSFLAIIGILDAIAFGPLRKVEKRR